MWSRRLRFAADGGLRVAQESHVSPVRPANRRYLPPPASARSVLRQRMGEEIVLTVTKGDCRREPNQACGLQEGAASVPAVRTATLRSGRPGGGGAVSAW